MKNKIHDEINQDQFGSDQEEAFISVLYTGFFLRDRLNKLLKPMELNITLYNILRILKGRHRQPARLQELKQVMIDKSANLSRCVDRLFQLGLCERQMSDSDRREVLVVLTPLGEERLKSLEPVMDPKALLGHEMNSEHCQELSGLLELFRRHFQQEPSSTST
jgi:DNA-binding MarR family transcriptional regulator